MNLKAKRDRIKALRGMQGFKIKLYKTTKESYLEARRRQKSLEKLMKELSAEIAAIDKERFKLGDLKSAPELFDGPG